MYAQLVTRTEYTAEQRLIERRFVEVEKDVADVQRVLAEDVKALKAAIDAAAERRGSNMRQAVYAGVLPAVLVLLGIVVQIWIALRGA
ncbi:hypothetical protein [Nonomuraea roseoviolacea]|uniref:DUF3618 domain-containing protein n=1 Tax=Nonomuraea roseoviolacea subsp. carminata TaxID=160689 RepID=A0ABT1K9F7_9ACTN|nr:hypothetical protein [Nonomuraea roseoviolacea]MCP2350606.1 hypothetical protein [Nonomuraea roseoviolacea subsp. carminata]